MSKSTPSKRFYYSRKFYISIGAVIIIGILFLILLDQVIMPAYTNHDEGVTVPNVTRVSLKEAEKNLSAYGLRYAVAERQSNDAFPEGYVIDQEPKSAKIVKPHRKIYLTVNTLSNRMAKVPKLIGLSLRNAKIQLRNLELNLGSISYESSRFKNTILHQSVQKGTLIKQGAEVDLVVSDGLGKQKVLVPKIIGMKLNEAEQELRKKGLRIGEIQYKASQKTPKTIISYYPNGPQLNQGQEVQLVVAERTGGKEPQEQPAVIDTTHQQPSH